MNTVVRRHLKFFAVATALASILVSNRTVEAHPQVEAVRNLIKDHHYKQASTVLTDLIKASPDDGDLRIVYGELLRETGQIDKSISEYAKAAELSSQNPYPLIALSELSMKQLDLDASLGYAQQAVACDPSCLEARIALVEVLLQSEQTAEAERQLKYFPSQAKGNAAVELLLYRLCQKKGDFISARRHLQAAIAASGTDAGLQLKFEECDLLQTLGEHNIARLELRKIIAGNADSVEAHLRLARLLETQFHDYAGALSNYNEALKLDPLSAPAIAGAERCQTKRQNIALQIKIALRELWDWIEVQSKNSKQTSR